MSIALIVLAAGKGTRMRSDLPKVLHELAGAPLLSHAMAAGRTLDLERSVVVAGHGADLVGIAARAEDPDAQVVIQEEQLGTGHAVACAREALGGFQGDALVLYGDTPFIRPQTLERMREARGEADIVVLGFEARDPGRYGRLVVEDGRLARIVEAKDATEAELRITLCNSGVVMAPAPLLMDLVGALSNENAAGEYYLTDIAAMAGARGLTASVTVCDEDETLGINSRAELAAAEAVFQRAARARLLEEGVTLTAPDTVILSRDTVIGRDAVIEPYVVFGLGVTVETGARIRAFSHLESAHVGAGCTVGPYARLRPGAELANGAKVGNFVEIKNAQIGEGAKVPHLSYVGDADIGDGANLGAGTITCNYDGVFKHRTVVGERAFVGSSTMLVAPVTVGAHAVTGSGSVITSDVPAGDLAIGRSRQVNKAGLGARLMQRLRALKAGKEQG